MRLATPDLSCFDQRSQVEKNECLRIELLNPQTLEAKVDKPGRSKLKVRVSYLHGSR